MTWLSRWTAHGRASALQRCAWSAGLDWSTTVITARGVHGSMADHEVAAHIGEWTGLRWVNHDSDDRERLAFLGATQRGTPVSHTATG
ncbi:MAG: DUF2088 domain-containing protein [Anaerolineae bacterium]|nr:DUF2088 domain-containing protein [Anaerolineae bacterium]